MKVLVKEPGKAPEEREIDGKLKTLQTIVGGCIEVVYTGTGGTVLICNEEGKLYGLQPNVNLTDYGRIVDVVVGTIIIMGVKDSDLIGLTDKQIRLMKIWIDGRLVC